ncbi:IPT/TIG domain-containing protein, partial [Ensifer sp. SSB1]|uniref:IPT/TIG domain-containing protein n=1 Tax=Ensifer sp. SSB1 TaxID=2795385 RepID=UPI0025BC1160
MDITNVFGLGAKDDTGAELAETANGSNGGLYEFRFNITNAQLQIKLLSAPPPGPDVYSGYMYNGPDGNPTPIANTPASLTINYLPQPAVTAVSPTSGPTAGGTTVVITGNNLLNATSVAFGGTVATGYTINSNTQITATAPAGTAGTVDITVTSPGGTSATSSFDQYTYVAAPTVTSRSPTSGPTAGGTTVTITGTGLTGATAVTFGGTAATGFTVNSNTQITATAPAGTGTVDIRVTNTGGTSATSVSDQYTYVPAPTVTSTSPIAGPTGGGTTVTITGTGFAAANPTGAVKFGATTATYTINSNTQITATAPANSAGTYDITVTTPGGTSATNANDQYTYLPAPTVTSTSPTSGPTGGGMTVTITGTGFSAANPTGAVKFGAANATYTINSNTQITATAPANSAGTYDITVTTPGGTSATNANDQ